MNSKIKNFNDKKNAISNLLIENKQSKIQKISVKTKRNSIKLRERYHTKN